MMKTFRQIIQVTLYASLAYETLAFGSDAFEKEVPVIEENESNQDMKTEHS